MQTRGELGLTRTELDNFKSKLSYDKSTGKVLRTCGMKEPRLTSHEYYQIQVDLKLYLEHMLVWFKDETS